MPASLDINTILGAPNLCGLIQETKSGVPNPFPPEFYITDKQVKGDQGSYYRVRGQRGVSTVTPYGAGPKQATLRNLVEVPVKLLHSYEQINLPMIAYQNLLEYDNLAVQKMGYSEVVRQITEFKRRMANSRIASLITTLFRGQVNYDSAGNFLPTSTGAATTLDFKIPTNSNVAAAGTPSNIGTAIDPFGTGTAIAGSTVASWASADTDIDKQVRAINQASIQLTGFPIKWGFYGKNLPTHLAKNTTLGTFMSRNIVVVNNQGGTNQAFTATNEIPDGVLDLHWRPAYQSFFEDQNGTIQSLVGDNTLLLLPDPTAEWLGTLEGSFPVPGDAFQPHEDAGAEIITDTQLRYGMFSYATRTLKPPTAEILAGDTWLHVLKNPLVAFVVTVA